MRTKGVPWEKCWQRAALDACSKAVCSLIPLISIWWHSTRLVLRLWWSINLFFSVLELEANWVIVKGARLNCFYLECQWKCLSLTYFLGKLHLKKWASMIMLFARLSGICRQLPHAGDVWLCQLILIKFVRRWGVPSFHPSNLLASISFVKELTLLQWWQHRKSNRCQCPCMFWTWETQSLTLLLNMFCECMILLFSSSSSSFFQNTVFAVRKRSEATVTWNSKATFLSAS